MNSFNRFLIRFSYLSFAIFYVNCAGPKGYYWRDYTLNGVPRFHTKSDRCVKLPSSIYYLDSLKNIEFDFFLHSASFKMVYHWQKPIPDPLIENIVKNRKSKDFPKIGLICHTDGSFPIKYIICYFEDTTVATILKNQIMFSRYGCLFCKNKDSLDRYRQLLIHSKTSGITVMKIKTEKGILGVPFIFTDTTVEIKDTVQIQMFRKVNKVSFFKMYLAHLFYPF